MYVLEEFGFGLLGCKIPLNPIQSQTEPQGFSGKELLSSLSLKAQKLMVESSRALSMRAEKLYGPKFYVCGLWPKTGCCQNPKQTEISSQFWFL